VLSPNCPEGKRLLSLGCAAARAAVRDAPKEAFVHHAPTLEQQLLWGPVWRDALTESLCRAVVDLAARVVTLETRAAEARRPWWRFWR
jgi:hypothetical protein